MAFHCSSCNGSMVFDVASQQMLCQHCGNTCDPQEFVVRDKGIVTCKACGATLRTGNAPIKFCPQCGERMELDDAGAGGDDASMARFTCESCGAELEGTEDSMIGLCPYCGGQSMIKQPSSDYTPEVIVPFQVDKNRCIELYKSYTKKVRFLPAVLRDSEFIQKFTGIYMPFYQYDVHFGRATLTGQKKVVSTPRYDEIEHYQFEATATDDYLRGVTFDGSRYLDDEISERVQPFTRQQQREFSPAYLAGFYADTSTVDAELYNEDAGDVAAQDLVAEATRQMSRERGITVHNNTDGVETSVLEHHSVLYPLWFLTWRNEDRVAYAVINGESGTVVSDLPLDLRAFARACGIVSVILFVVLELLFQPTPMVTSLISLAAGLLMGYGIRRSARQEYEKQLHANDKGWAGEQENGKAKKRRKKLSESSLAGLMIAIFFTIALAGGFLLADAADWLLSILRFILPFVALVHSLFVGIQILRWHKHIHSRDALLAALSLVVTVALNAAIVLVSPVNDGWYYIGDAVCILGLVLTSVTMIRLYNLGTTRPLPKLFDRTEVPS